MPRTVSTEEESLQKIDDESTINWRFRKIHASVWFIRDGAPPHCVSTSHFSIKVHKQLNKTCPNRRIVEMDEKKIDLAL
ncbi:hypothetical protein ABEB36_008249 [Hypothenemus hampei]|uniref:Uncharacterized protein n=1 Tax=Hypothenemus hampei TaxID=57062 RepID=A0ABD1EL83_HYPHA